MSIFYGPFSLLSFKSGHSNAQGDGNYGQNIGAGYSPDQISDLIDAFMAEQPLYPGPYGEDNIDISNFEDWGHYSQVCHQFILSLF